ncbi:MAG: L-serine dehydratase 2 [Chlamydiia bacterium]|nr:L-serine dehydratase 2 [Chlamydiia bacterium]MCH9615772.1 L-serine dehydratase 2 [Chlamydiia bacterium]MCH9628825.1 L-serine dehydratase 2 [Chlamydiia bacterium]
MVSVFDLFSIGIGPSSSHTVGPMRAAKRFALEAGDFDSVTIELYGSLAMTGEGHATDKAILLGLLGHTPEGIDSRRVEEYLDEIKDSGKLNLLGVKDIPFDIEKDLTFVKGKFLPFHSNAMRFKTDTGLNEVFYSIGGGFILKHGEKEGGEKHVEMPYPFDSSEELLAHGLPIDEVMMENEKATRTEEEIKSGLFRIWEVMQDSVVRGVETEGRLPGGLDVPRRAPEIYRKLTAHGKKCYQDPALIMDWTSLFALAVNEENAAGGQVVTAPTNGAAGVIPSVLHYYRNFIPEYSEEGALRFLLVSAAIGILYKKGASLSAAEMGCQGEVGVACSMAAGALCAVLGGTNEQIEHAATIGMKHNLGLTCDPVGGLVQIPCIERNTMGAVKAINAARLALFEEKSGYVSLDEAIKAMFDTGKAMQTRFKETSEGGLATTVASKIPVSLPEC